MRQCLSANPWFAYYRPRPAARVRLFCLPYAGGGAALYRGWQENLPEAVEVVPVQLPGRETRFREAPVTRLAALADALAHSIAEYGDKPVALFGHSMGALLAFEVARRLHDQHKIDPEYLFPSGCTPPHKFRTEQPIHRLADREFLRELRRLNGTEPEVFDQPELVELLLPQLRADFAACETYTYQPGPPLRCPVLALGGLNDASTPAEHLRAWREQTAGEFALRLLPGDHFFVRSAATGLFRTIAQQLLAPKVAPDRTGEWHKPAEPWPLAADEVQVWRFALDQPSEVRTALWHHLSSDERARAQRFHFRKDCDRFIVGRGTLRLILGHFTGQAPESLTLCTTAHGKPRLIDAGTGSLRFNLAHSEGLALVALGRAHEVGVDLEYVRSDIAKDEIAARFFSPRERATLAALPAGQKLQAFFHCWTRKEAYLKAVGKGLSRALDGFDVSLAPGEPPALLEDREDIQAARRWALHHLAPAPGFVGAVAAEGQPWRLRCGEWPSLLAATWHTARAAAPAAIAADALARGGR